MKTLPILLGLSCTALLFTACEYDDQDYRARSVSVSTGGAYYGGAYDEYSPYYSYSGRRYYRTGSRYVYYTANRPYYVSALPSGANYITPRRSYRSSGTVGRTYRDEPAVTRYDTTAQRRTYESQSGRSDWRERERSSSQQRATQNRVQSSPSVEIRREPVSPRVQAQTNVQSVPLGKVQRVPAPSKVRAQTNQATVEKTDGRPVKRSKQKDD